jgi:hypothetical protein
MITTRHKHAPDVIVTDFEDELVLLDPSNGEMFGLNACGRRIWLELPTKSITQIAEALCSDFQVTPERAYADVNTVLTALIDAGLVVHDDTAAE